MIAVIFEVHPDPTRKQDYLDTAADLKAELENHDGFISVERFQSLSNPDKLLSLSFFRDENAVAAWRKRDCHQTAQSSGRRGIFVDYRLRIADVLRDYGMFARTQAPTDSKDAHD